MRRNLAKRSDKQRLLRPRLEVKEEVGFDRSDVKKALLESLHEQRRKEYRKKLTNELKRRGNHVKNRLPQKDLRASTTNVHGYDNTRKKQKKNWKLNDEKEKKRKAEGYTSKGKSFSRGKEKIKIPEIKINRKVEAKSLEVNKDAGIVKNKNKTKIPEEKITEEKDKISEIILKEANTIIESVEQKNVKKDLDIDTLPSTRDFVRFMSLDYSEDSEDIPKELRHFRALPLVAVPWSISSK